MSYRVEYNPELRRNYPQKMVRTLKVPVKLLLLGLAACVGTYILFGTGLFNLFIPGDPQVTVAAFSEMVQDVGAGEGVSEAVFHFFRNVVVPGVRGCE